jgi:hypothetical protein
MLNLNGENSGSEPLASYTADGMTSVQLGSEIKPLIAEFSREGVDLTLTDASGDHITVEGYFSSFPGPDLLTAGGAKITFDVASKLAGPGPLAQSAATDSDAGGPIGEVPGLTGVVTAQHTDGTTDSLVEGAAVFQGDVLVTGDGSSFSIVFVDETEFSMGANGRAVLDELIYNPSSGDGTFGVSLLQGVFSLVSGQIAKDEPENVSVKTPVGTIGIRGTSYSGEIKSIGEESIITLFSGAIVVVNEGGSQELTIANQSVIVTSYSSAPSTPFILTGQQLFDLYGDTMRITNPDFFDDEDFDPDKINPEGGRRSDGGGADFQNFAAQSILGGLDIGGLLGAGDLLDPTQLDFLDQSNIDEIVGLGPQTQLSVNAIVDPETGNLASFQVIVSLTEPVGQPVTITYEIRPGSATGADTGLPGDVDFVDGGTGVVVIPAGQLSSSFTVNVLDDDVIEGLEFFIVALTGADNAAVSVAFGQAVITIVDDDIGIVSVSDVTIGGAPAASGVTVDESAGVITYELALDKALAPGVSVNINYVISGTATAGSDYTTDAVQTATFFGGTTGLPAGSVITIDVPIIDDDIYEAAESLTLTLVGGSSNSVITDPASFTVNITDNDPLLGEATNVVVDEDDLAGGTDATPDPTTVTGTVALTYDEGSVSAVNLDISGLPSLTSGNDPVTYQLNILPDGVTQQLTAIATPEEGAPRTVFTLDFAPNGDGTNYGYSFTLLDVIDHAAAGQDGQVLPFGYDVVSTDGSTVSGSFTATIVDDVPIASPDIIDLPAPELPAYNLVFVIDTSGSMSFPVVGGTGTRMEVVREARTNGLDAYNVEARALNITIIGFAGFATVVFEGTSVEEAQAFINDPSNLTPDGSTNYAAAVANDENGAQGVLEGHQADPALEGYDDFVYFISDGAPSTGGGVPTAGGNQWQAFVDDPANDIEVVAVGIGSDTSTPELAAVENSGDEPTIVTDPSGLSAALVDTIPVVEIDNVVTSGVADLFGADDGSLTALTFEGISYDIPQNGDVLEIETDLGSMISIDMAGNYVYTAPQSVDVGETEIFGYTLTDGDGDTSDATLTFNFTDAGAVAASSFSAFAFAAPNTLAGTDAADSFAFGPGSTGDTVITDFDVSEDTVNLDQLFDGLGLLSEERGEGDAWTLSDTAGKATLTLVSNNEFSVIFDNFSNPDIQTLDDLATRIIVDES